MSIQSEIQPLKQVLVHFPYNALNRLTPSNCDHFLFDDVLWPEKAQLEHDAFIKLLIEQGVEVLFIETLLKQAIENPEAKQRLIQKCLYLDYHGTQAELLLKQYFNHLSNKELVRQLLGGVTFRELQPYSLGLVSKVTHGNDFIVPPIPNLLFTRDSSIWIQQDLCLARMACSLRKPESAIVSTIYHYHPLFQKSHFSKVYSGDDSTQVLPNLEGGDILVINAHSLLIGLGQRTQPQAIEILAKRLFQDNSIVNIIVVEIPKKRVSMHLDTLLTMIDHDTFCSFYPKLNFRCWLIRPGKAHDDLVIEAQTSLTETLCCVLGLKKIRIISPKGDTFSLEREQWNDAVNLLAVQPAKVFTYEQNKLINQQLQQAGIETIPIPGSELGRGRGGPRCMTCPISRGTAC